MFSVTVSDGDQREVLVDHAEAGGDRVARRAERHGLAVDADLARVGLVEPGQDVHERALAGAVLAEQGVDLARPQVEVDVVVGDDAGEALDDAAHLDRRRGVGRRAVIAGSAAWAWSVVGRWHAVRLGHRDGGAGLLASGGSSR